MNIPALLTTLKLLKHRGALTLMADMRTQIRLHFLFAAAESGLLPALRAPHSRRELVVLLGVTREDLLDALLDLGVSTGELTVHDGTYEVVGRRSKAMLDPQGDMFVALVQAQCTYYNTLYRDLPERLRGGPLDHRLEQIGELVARVSKISDPFLRTFVQRAVTGKGTRRVLEIGCGSGAHLRAAANANAALTGVGLELDPAVVKQARHNLEDWGLSERIQVLEGDIRSPGEIGCDFDLITMYNVVYYFRADERGTVFASLRRLLRSGGTLAIATSARSNGRDALSANLDIATRSMVGCSALPELAELHAMLRDSGFSVIETTRLIPGSEYWGIIARCA